MTYITEQPKHKAQARHAQQPTVEARISFSSVLRETVDLVLEEEYFPIFSIVSLYYTTVQK
jgi:hypothetical protein